MNWVTTKQGNRIDLDLYKAVEDYYEGMNFPTLYLNKKEYGVVVAEVDKVYERKYKKKYICTYHSGNASNQTDKSYTYVFENHGFNVYRFIDKMTLGVNYYKGRKKK